jgi:iron-sulfur cluster repair protein YtfE (RIC family)
MNESTLAARPTGPELAEWTINELVAAYPATMLVLAPLGIDLCCGGLHPLGEALDRHGYDRAAVLEQVVAAIDDAVGPPRGGR